MLMATSPIALQGRTLGSTVASAPCVGGQQLEEIEQTSEVPLLPTTLYMPWHTACDS